MGSVIPFVARVRDSGDWTAAERARLDALGERFAAMGVTVDVVYGVTDDGDPWCVVKDQDEEILVHVARIGGRFVVHYAADDDLAEATDLPSALGERLMAMDEADDDHVVVPFAAGGRQAQVLLALVAATAFFYETREAHAEAAPELPAEPPGDAPVVAATSLLAIEADVRVERATINHTGALGETETPETSVGRWAEPDSPAFTLAARPGVEDAAPLAPDTAEAPAIRAAGLAAPEAPAAPQDGQVLTGTAGAELIRGGDGADTLSGGGAPAGQFDTLDGGAGDDRIEVTAQVVAIGGQGADAFVIADPGHFGDATVFLGFIADFRAAEGDHLEGHHGRPVLPLAPPGDSDLNRFQPPLPPGVMTDASTETVFVDLDGDGRADGFLVMGHGPGSPPPPTGDFADHGVHFTTTLVGHAFPPPDIG